MKLGNAVEAMQSAARGSLRGSPGALPEDGEVIVSPVWFRVHDDAFEVDMASGHRKLPLLRRDPRCTLLIFETMPPFRGVPARSRATLAPDDGARTRLAIASRYLSEELGRRYADTQRRPPGAIVRLPLADARAWDLSASLPWPHELQGAGGSLDPRRG